MNNNQYKSIFSASYLIGLLLLPFLSFSQQQNPNRISVVVTAQELSGNKEIVQLPADNFPKVIDKPAGTTFKSTSKRANRATAINESAKEKKLATPPPALIKREAKAPLTPTNTIAKKTAIAANKPLKKSAKAPSLKEEENTTASKVAIQPKPAKAQQSKQPTEILKVEKTVATARITNETATTSSAKIDQQSTTIHENTATTKANSMSYIWIGAFLIAAGLVLGLLFGKPAFLISFVGVVFIILGIVL